MLTRTPKIDLLPQEKKNACKGHGLTESHVNGGISDTVNLGMGKIFGDMNIS